MGGDDEGVAPVAGLVAGAAMVAPPAATAVAREELGGEAEGADWFMAGGAGVAPWAEVLAVVVWIREVVCGGMAVGGDLVELWLLQGGVVLCWAGEPAGLSSSMGEVAAGGLAAAAAA